MGRSGQSRYRFMPGLDELDFAALSVERTDHRIYRIPSQSINVVNSLGLHGPDHLVGSSVSIFTPHVRFCAVVR